MATNLEIHLQSAPFVWQLLAQRGQLDFSGAHKVSISLFPILLGAVLFGPLGAMAVSVASMLGRGDSAPYEMDLVRIKSLSDWCGSGCSRDHP